MAETLETPSTEPMELENGPLLKRHRDEDEDSEATKKLKSEKSVEEQRLENNKVSDVEQECTEAKLGPKTFGSSVEMFDYFFKFLRFWTPNININKYEYMVLLELVKKGHPEPDQKIGAGVRAFQVRYHPQYKSRCFFLLREDDSVDDFSFRKCVNHILPLPENMQVNHDVNKALTSGGKGGGGGRGGGRGRGRGVKPRN
ncbi:hypothetical protein Leryth_014237 [Lithospermum erythrorhizon]|nr:hypothetical protein Leryth_014237 [Lithospermum erythrorhizon]